MNPESVADNSTNDIVIATPDEVERRASELSFTAQPVASNPAELELSTAQNRLIVGSIAGSTAMETDLSEPLESHGARVESETVRTPVTADITEKKTIKNGANDRDTRIYFRIDSTTIDQQYFLKLDEIIDYLNQSEDLAHIIGYADSSGDPAYNQALSLKRASTVAYYLVKNNIETHRIVIEGRGIFPESDKSGSKLPNPKKSHRVVEISIVPASN